MGNKAGSGHSYDNLSCKECGTKRTHRIYFRPNRTWWTLEKAESYFCDCQGCWEANVLEMDSYCRLCSIKLGLEW